MISIRFAEYTDDVIFNLCREIGFCGRILIQHMLSNRIAEAFVFLVQHASSDNIASMRLHAIFSEYN